VAESDGEPRVFISWSGPLAQEIAQHISKFLPNVIQAFKPWMSENDISAGSFWVDEVMKGLQNARVGLVILTPENLNRPWLHYEAGYLTRYIRSGQGLVSPILINLEASALTGPLSSLNSTEFKKEKFEKLMKDMNQKLERPVPDPVLGDSFEAFWGRLKEQVDASVAKANSSGSLEKKFNQEDVLTQIQANVRELAARSIDPKIVQQVLISNNKISKLVLAQAKLLRSLSKDELQPADSAHKAELDSEVDSLLDEIEDVLDVDAEEFVRSFVRKGGE
jgi:ubiquitin-like protein Pup